MLKRKKRYYLMALARPQLYGFVFKELKKKKAIKKVLIIEYILKLKMMMEFHINYIIKKN